MTRWKEIAIGFAGVAAACAGWLATDALEANNDFCNACHLATGAVLHEEIRKGFDARPVHNLAGIHGSSERKFGGGTREFRCIDCHAGVGWVGRAKVKLLAAKDALVWVTGDFDEPDHMEYPLGEADCRQCHREFELDELDELDVDADAESEVGASVGAGVGAGVEFVRFHGNSVHNVELGVVCVECHSVHVGGDDRSTFYLDARSVRQQCARCHSEYAE